MVAVDVQHDTTTGDLKTRELKPNLTEVITTRYQVYAIECRSVEVFDDQVRVDHPQDGGVP